MILNFKQFIPICYINHIKSNQLHHHIDHIPKQFLTDYLFTIITKIPFIIQFCTFVTKIDIIILFRLNLLVSCIFTQRIVTFSLLLLWFIIFNTNWIIRIILLFLIETDGLLRKLERRHLLEVWIDTLKNFKDVNHIWCLSHTYMIYRQNLKYMDSIMKRIRYIYLLGNPSCY